MDIFSKIEEETSAGKDKPPVLTKNSERAFFIKAPYIPNYLEPSAVKTRYEYLPKGEAGRGTDFMTKSRTRSVYRIIKQRDKVVSPKQVDKIKALVEKGVNFDFLSAEEKSEILVLASNDIICILAEHGFDCDEAWRNGSQTRAERAACCMTDLNATNKHGFPYVLCLSDYTIAKLIHYGYEFEIKPETVENCLSWARNAWSYDGDAYLEVITALFMYGKISLTEEQISQMKDAAYFAEIDLDEKFLKMIESTPERAASQYSVKKSLSQSQENEAKEQIEKIFEEAEKTV